MIYLDSARLREIMHTVLREKGVDETSALHVIEGTVSTSLRGVDSHGINIFPHYCRSYDSGRLNKQPQFRTEKRAPGVLVINGDHAVGHHAGAYAIDAAIELAKLQGVAVAKVDDSSHFGAAAYFALRAAEQDMIGLSFTNADALVKAFGGKEAFFGTNPICFAAPLANEEPLCIDMATSLVSWNKIKNYRREGADIPDHWAFDGEGESVTDPNLAKSLSPIGDYKGFILGMMVDILCATLTGSMNSKDMLPMYTSDPAAPRQVGHFFMAMSIAAFSDVDAFKQRLQHMVDRLRDLPGDPQGRRVMAPGDPEKAALPLRLVEGIPVHETIFEEFLAVSGLFKGAVMT